MYLTQTHISPPKVVTQLRKPYKDLSSTMKGSHFEWRLLRQCLRVTMSPIIVLSYDLILVHRLVDFVPIILVIVSDAIIIWHVLARAQGVIWRHLAKHFAGGAPCVDLMWFSPFVASSPLRFIGPPWPASICLLVASPRKSPDQGSKTRSRTR